MTTSINAAARRPVISSIPAARREDCRATDGPRDPLSRAPRSLELWKHAARCYTAGPKCKRMKEWGRNRGPSSFILLRLARSVDLVNINLERGVIIVGVNFCFAAHERGEQHGDQQQFPPLHGEPPSAGSPGGKPVRAAKPIEHGIVRRPTRRCRANELQTSCRRFRRESGADRISDAEIVIRPTPRPARTRPRAAGGRCRTRAGDATRRGGAGRTMKT